MKIVLLLACLSLLSACGGSGGSSPSPAVQTTSASTDPVFGTWYFKSVGTTSSSGSGFIGTIDEKGNVKAMALKFVSDGTSAYVVYRKSIGTYVRNGSQFQMSYSYETCKPVHTETLSLVPSGDKLIMTSFIQPTQIILTRLVDDSSSPMAMAMVEDVNCNLF